MILSSALVRLIRAVLSYETLIVVQNNNNYSYSTRKRRRMRKRKIINGDNDNDNDMMMNNVLKYLCLPGSISYRHVQKEGPNHEPSTTTK